jgi:hypothetical protein
MGMNTNTLRKIQQWECKPTGYRTADYQEPEMLLNIKEDKEIGPPMGFGTLDEYTWHIRFGVSFRANSAQLERARENAAQILLHEIYGPIKQEIRKALSATYSQDYRAAGEALHSVLNLIEDK